VILVNVVAVVNIYTDTVN